jgi:CHAT domain-containing protein
MLADMGEDAVRHLNEALRLYDQGRTAFASASDPHGLGRVAMGEGVIRSRLANHGVESEENLKAALRLFAQARTAFPSGDPDLPRCLGSEASARFGLAERGIDARHNLEEAVRLFAQVRDASPAAGADRGSAVSGEGLAREQLAALGVDPEVNLATAARLLREAGDQQRSRGFLVDALRSYRALAGLARRREDWTLSHDALERAIAVLEDMRYAAVLMDDRKAWMERSSWMFREMVETCLRLDRLTEALEYVERGRSRNILDLLAAEESAPRNVAAARVDTYRKLRRRLEEIQFLQLRQSPNASREAMVQLAAERIEVTRQLTALEEEFRSADPDYAALARSLDFAGIAALAAALDRALVVLWVGESRSAAFCVRPTGDLEHLVLPAVTQALTMSWLAGPPDERVLGGWMGTYLRRTREGPEKASLDEWIGQMSATLDEVSSALTRPLHDWLAGQGVQRIALLTSGELALLPLHATSWCDGATTRWFGEEIEVVYAPSAWILARCQARRRRRWTPVLAIADPDGSLRFGEWEVDALSTLVAAVGGSVTAMVGSGAALPAVSSALASHPVAYFSCHARWDNARPMESALSLSGGALTLGLLIGRVRLEEARLIVLSACESVTGYGPGSQEYLGLPAGFVIAGAKSVVGSLWSVPEPATALLMVEMWENLLAGMTVSEALTKAQAWLRALSRDDATLRVADSGRFRPLAADYREWIAGLPDPPFAHPYYWGAFEAVGSPDRITDSRGPAQTAR